KQRTAIVGFTRPTATRLATTAIDAAPARHLTGRARVDPAATGRKCGSRKAVDAQARDRALGASPKAAAILDTPWQALPARVMQLPEGGPDLRRGRVLMRYSLRKVGLAVV